MSVEGIGAAKIELDILTTFQRRIHLQDDDSEIISSKFHYQFTKTSWSANLIEEMDATIRKDGDDITFVANQKFDFLLYTYIVQDIQAMKVAKKARKKVQICMPHNFGHNIIGHGSVRVDGISLQNIDSTWLDIYSQFYMKPGMREHYDIMIGNVPFLQEWGTSIPGYTVVVPQPFHYSKDPAVALPLFMKSLSRVTHNYNFRRKLSEIVRMRIIDDDEWKEIPYNWSYMEAVKQDEMLTQPRMFGRYVVITKEERNWHQGIDADGSQDKHKPPRIVYGENIVKVTHTNTSGLGQSVGLTLHSSTPTKAMFWVAENMEAQKYNNRSNYTTNPNNINEGWNPICETSLTYGGVAKFSEMPSYHFDMSEPWHSFVSAPSEPGYNGFSFAYDTSTIHGDVGIVFNGIGSSGVTLTTKLGDTDPFLKKVIDKRRRDEEIDPDSFVPDEIKGDASMSDNNGPSFKVIAYLLTTTKMTFPSEGKISIDRGVVPGVGVSNNILGLEDQ